MIDGFVRKTQNSRPVNRTSAKSALVVLKQATAKREPHKPADAVHKRTQHSKTLMRRVVNKPHSTKTVKPSQKQFSASSGTSDIKRFSRAMNVVKSSRVRRFSRPVSQSNTLTSHPATHYKNPSRRSSGTKKVTTTAAIARPVPSMITSVSHQRLERMLDEALIKADGK